LLKKALEKPVFKCDVVHHKTGSPYINDLSNMSHIEEHNKNASSTHAGLEHARFKQKTAAMKKTPLTAPHRFRVNTDVAARCKPPGSDLVGLHGDITSQRGHLLRRPLTLATISRKLLQLGHPIVTDEYRTPECRRRKCWAPSPVGEHWIYLGV
jgi:hypothetical protein